MPADHFMLAVGEGVPIIELFCILFVMAVVFWIVMMVGWLVVKFFQWLLK
jgi:hypothetical protein